MLRVAVIFGYVHGREIQTSNFKHTKTKCKRTNRKVRQEIQWLRKRNPSMFESISACQVQENVYSLEEKLGV